MINNCSTNESIIPRYRYVLVSLEFDFPLYALNNWYITNNVNATVIAFDVVVLLPIWLNSASNFLSQSLGWCVFTQSSIKPLRVCLFGTASQHGDFYCHCHMEEVCLGRVIQLYRRDEGEIKLPSITLDAFRSVTSLDSHNCFIWAWI